MTSNAESTRNALYYLIEDFVVSLLVGGALAATLVMIDGSPKAVLATALGAPGAYFLGQRLRRLRSKRKRGTVVPRP